MTGTEFEIWLDSIVPYEKNTSDDDSALATDTDIDQLLAEVRAIRSRPTCETAVLNEVSMEIVEDILPLPDSEPPPVIDDTGQGTETEFGFIQYHYSGESDPFADRNQIKEQQKKKSSLVSNILFYSFVICAVMIAFIFTTGSTAPRNIFGYSYFEILTKSMQSELPKGSLVITKQVDPYSIQTGDDITYLQNDHTTITHRVIAITENYGDNGERGFQTQGIDNPAPDKDIVFANNVVGKVIFSSPGLGTILQGIRQNVWFICLFMAAFLIACVCIQKYRKMLKEEKAAKTDTADTGNRKLEFKQSGEISA